MLMMPCCKVPRPVTTASMHPLSARLGRSAQSRQVSHAKAWRTNMQLLHFPEGPRHTKEWAPIFYPPPRHVPDCICTYPDLLCLFGKQQGKPRKRQGFLLLAEPLNSLGKREKRSKSQRFPWKGKRKGKKQGKPQRQGKEVRVVATIHFSLFTDEWFTDFLFIQGLFPQQEGSFCPFTNSLGNHGRMLHSFTPFPRVHSLHSRE